MRVLVGILIASIGSSAFAQQATVGPIPVDVAPKSAGVPANGPGPGLCKDTVLPSQLISSGGITGAAGTCSLIVQCGTSPTYVVKQFNVGSGC